MAKFKVKTKTKSTSDGSRSLKERDVEAAYFDTVGEFIDFWGARNRDRDDVVLRIRADSVQEIERVEE